MTEEHINQTEDNTHEETFNIHADTFKIHNETFTDVSNYVKVQGSKGRVDYGSKKEFQFKVLSSNWLMNNSKLGVLLGISAGSVSRLRRFMREKPQMLEVAFNDYMTLKSSGNVPDTVKYNGAVKLLTMLIASDVDHSKIDNMISDSKKIEDACRQYDIVFKPSEPFNKGSSEKVEALREDAKL